MSQAPSAQTGTYPLADEVMQLSRSMVNDMLRDTAGRILTNTAPFTIPYLNSAIRRTQRYFANNGLESFIVDNFILTGITPVQSLDPSVQVFISSSGYFDGVKMNAQPTLPPDLIIPLAVWERQTASGASFAPVHPTSKDGLPSRIPGQTFDLFEWRNDKINLLGSTLTTDLRLRYEGMIPAIATNQDLTKVSIPLRDAHEALAAWVIYFYAFARGSAMRLEAKKIAQEEMDEVVNRYVRKDERIAYRPQGFRSGGGTIDGALTGSYK
jgi:hypothetical protein